MPQSFLTPELFLPRPASCERVRRDGAWWRPLVDRSGLTQASFSAEWRTLADFQRQHSAAYDGSALQAARQNYSARPNSVSAAQDLNRTSMISCSIDERYRKYSLVALAISEDRSIYARVLQLQHYIVSCAVAHLELEERNECPGGYLDERRTVTLPGFTTADGVAIAPSTCTAHLTYREYRPGFGSYSYWSDYSDSGNGFSPHDRQAARVPPDVGTLIDADEFLPNFDDFCYFLGDSVQARTPVTR